MNKYQVALDWSEDEFHIRLRKVIKQSGYSQKDIAMLLGTSESNVSKWTNGYQYPRRITIEELSEILGVDLLDSSDNLDSEEQDMTKSINNIQKHKKLLSELHETYKEKNQKYGDSFTETVEKYGLIAAITRMHDKFSRIENIITQKAEDDEDERLVDSLKDLANYCLMTAMVLEDKDD